LIRGPKPGHFPLHISTLSRVSLCEIMSYTIIDTNMTVKMAALLEDVADLTTVKQYRVTFAAILPLHLNGFLLNF